MAKLSAHGKEVARYSKESVPADPKSYTNWERVTYALMEDGVLLAKVDVRFKPADYELALYPKGRPHSYGWKRKGRLAETGTNTQEALFARLEKQGYAREARS